ncbi:hypothetical protein CGLO_05043 [Colletotrichum gloeosporioides Cg-14]|uniref:Uncharacterized protein n=1 Tax=Colletotrichum gloeosporioides (strain Cg-14) TaxID=1237896 RepID=T0LTH7_COLGC|nr:hypothetical protein CGLO_05043 [Colletotrichum gloeosporioides Cg-14]
MLALALSGFAQAASQGGREVTAAINHRVETWAGKQGGRTALNSSSTHASDSVS